MKNKLLVFIAIFIPIIAGTFLLYFTIFDKKDACLDTGGTYQNGACVMSEQQNTMSENITQDSQQNTTPLEATISYPTSATDSVASRFCESKNGVISIEKENSVDVAYCMVDNQKIDAWKFFSDNQ